MEGRKKKGGVGERRRGGAPLRSTSDALESISLALHVRCSMVSIRPPPPHTHSICSLHPPSPGPGRQAAAAGGGRRCCRPRPPASRRAASCRRPPTPQRPPCWWCWCWWWWCGRGAAYASCCCWWCRTWGCGWWEGPCGVAGSGGAASGALPPGHDGAPGGRWVGHRGGAPGDAHPGDTCTRVTLSG